MGRRGSGVRGGGRGQARGGGARAQSGGFRQAVRFWGWWGPSRLVVLRRGWRVQRCSRGTPVGGAGPIWSGMRGRSMWGMGRGETLWPPLAGEVGAQGQECGVSPSCPVSAVPAARIEGTVAGVEPPTWAGTPPDLPKEAQLSSAPSSCLPGLPLPSPSPPSPALRHPPPLPGRGPDVWANASSSSSSSRSGKSLGCPEPLFFHL